MKRLALLFIFLLSGCLAQPTPAPTITISAPMILSAEENPRAPHPGDEKFNREGVIITSVNLIARVDLNPTRIQINPSGSMPSTCGDLRLQVKPPDADYRIFIEAYSLTDPKKKCENVFQQFETNILLGVYSPGRYTIWVNENLIGDFVAY